MKRIWNFWYTENSYHKGITNVSITTCWVTNELLGLADPQEMNIPLMPNRRAGPRVQDCCCGAVEVHDKRWKHETIECILSIGAEEEVLVNAVAQ